MARSFIDWWRARRRRLFQLWGIGIVVSVTVTAASAIGYLEIVQAKTLDVLMRLRAIHGASDVVIVAIDDAAFEAVGERQPLPRGYLVKILRGLQRSGAAVVGLDLVLSTATTAEDDAALAELIREFSDNGLSRLVLTATPMPPTGPLADESVLRGIVRGSPDVPQDDGAVVRRASFLVPHSRRGFQPALSIAVAARLGGMDQPALEGALVAPSGITLPRWRSAEARDLVRGEPIRVRPGELERINYVGPARTFLTIPSETVAALGEPGTPVAADNPFRGRVVLVGATFQESRDHFMTPHGLMPGVEVHANLVHMLLTRSFIRPSGWAISLGLQIGVVILGSLAIVLCGVRVGTIVAVSIGVVVGLPASYLAFQRGAYWVDFMLPIVATRYLASVAQSLEGRRIRQAFGRHVSPEVASRVLAEAPSLEGERREVSILFSDIRGFTTFSETLAPDEVAHRLNEYFDVMTAAIFRYQGMVNDFIGDAVFAIFGAPLRDRDHALHAVQAALAMIEGLDVLNARWQAAGLPPLRMGVGVHSGEVFAGNIGGRMRVKYTIIGDAVNTASRVEGLNKDLSTTILITEQTRAAVGRRIDAKDKGQQHVKGREQTVHVHEVLAIAADDAATEIAQ